MIVYLITNNINGKQYVGQTSRELSVRIDEHFRDKDSKLPLHKAIRKYGQSNFTVTVLKRCKSEQELDKTEGMFIKKLNTTTPNGYNLTPGGNSGRAGYRHTEDYKRLRSIQYKGKGNPNYGKRYTDTAKFAGFKGRKHTEETKKLISDKLKGRVVSEQTRQKIREANIGRKDNRGDAISEAKGRKVIHIPSGEIYTSVARASLDSNITEWRIICSCNGQLPRPYKNAKTALPLEYQYYDEYMAILSQALHSKEGATTIPRGSTL